MKVRWNPKQQRFPKLTGKVIVDTFRGQIRVRKWPRKRGPSKLAKQQRQVAWFTNAKALAKRVWPEQTKLAMVMTKGTGLYPQDLLLRQMSGGIYDIFMPDGTHYQPRTFFRETKMFQGVILQLDAALAFPANAGVFPNWPLPLVDTLGFWDVAAPSFITIPEGINIVELSASLSITPDGNGFICSIFSAAPTVWGEASAQGWSQNSRFFGTGPVPVTAGQQFRVRGVSQVARNLDLVRRNFFALNVLDAD